MTTQSTITQHVSPTAQASELIELLDLLQTEMVTPSTRRVRPTENRPQRATRAAASSTTASRPVREVQVLRETALPGGTALQLLVDCAVQSRALEADVVRALSGEKYLRRIEDVTGAVRAIGELLAVAEDEGVDDVAVPRARRWLKNTILACATELDRAAPAPTLAPSSVSLCCDVRGEMEDGWQNLAAPSITCPECKAVRTHGVWTSEAPVLVTAVQAERHLSLKPNRVAVLAHRGRLAPAGRRKGVAYFDLADVRAAVA